VELGPPDDDHGHPQRHPGQFQRRRRPALSRRRRHRR
jgi:hypothetical protein